MVPLIDRLQIPFITLKFGFRKSWLLLFQVLLIITLILIGIIDPQKNLYVMAIAVVFLAFFSSNQDAMIDAYRVELSLVYIQTALSSV